ncbi:MAG: lysophospholipid acyltransferase family protein [Pseudomonadota bacterium]
MQAMATPVWPKPLLAGWRGIRRVWRTGRVLVHIAAGFALTLATGALFVQHRPAQQRAARWWLHRLTKILAVEITVTGTPTKTAALFVANHVSWLDIPVLGGVAPIHFLSKAEVAQWPLIGRLATAAGTLYIRRGKGEIRQRTRQIGEHIAAGRSVLVFPEGTTTNGGDVNAFHTPLFMAATANGHAVQPVAIRYVTADGSLHPHVPFIGDDAFHTHLWRLLNEERIFVRVHFLPPVATDGRDHKSLAAAVHAQVRGLIT